MIVNGDSNSTVSVGGFDLLAVSELRFLGVVIDDQGTFKP